MKNLRLLLTVTVFSCQAYGQDNLLTRQSWSAAASSALHKLTFQVFRKKINDNSVLPLEVVTTLSEHTKELQKLSDQFNQQGIQVGGKGVCQVEWLPGYFIKHGIDRFENTKKLNRFIRDKNLDLISPLEEYLFHIPAKPFNYSSDNYLVIAKKAPGEHPSSKYLLHPAQLTQLNHIENNLPHNDLHCRNLVVAENCTITIIDTDRCAMGENIPTPKWWHD